MSRRARLTAACAAALLAAPAISSFTLASGTVPNGGATTGTVTVLGALPSPIGAATVVALRSSNPGVATVPASVAVPFSGHATFAVHATPGAPGGCTVISAAVVGSAPKEVSLRVQPPASSGPLSLTHVPTALFGGTTAEAYVSLITTTAQPGLVVHMSSSSPDVTVPSALKMTASVPNEAGAYVMADSFPVRTRTVSVPTCGVITVTGASSTRYALVTLIAPAG